MTILETHVRMPGGDHDLIEAGARFDPLVELQGQWNTRLADRYRPLGINQTFHGFPADCGGGAVSNPFPNP